LVEYREWDETAIRLVTGADKEDWFTYGRTKITVTTYGMMWYCLTGTGGQGLRTLLEQHSAFLLDELAASVSREKGKITADPQFVEAAGILWPKVL